MRRVFAHLALVLLVGACERNPVEPLPRQVTSDSDAPLFALIGPVSQVSAGSILTCALGSDGSVTCWGGAVTAPTGVFKQVDAGHFHACGIRSDDTVACWGSFGQQQSAPGGTFAEVSAGYQHTCGRRPDGSIECWGGNGSGQGSPPPGSYTQVSAGGFHSCALRSDGTIACWGENSYGQTTAPAGTYSLVTVGSFHSCGLKTDGSIVCWGRNDFGPTNVPVGVFTDVSAGGFHTCGVSSNGSVACWGYNAYGQINVPAGTFTRVSAGDFHTCAIKSGASIACWGLGSSGQTTVPSPPAPGIVPVGVEVPVNAVDGITGELAPVLLTFDNVITGGTVTVTSGQVGPNATPGAPPAPSSSNFRLGSPPLYYNITTAAVFTGSVQVCVTYPELSFKNSTNLRLLHYEGGAWVVLPDQTVNTATRTVCASTGSFSPFMIGEIQLAPVVTQVLLTANPIPVNTATQLQATFTDENLDDTHTGSFSWNSGSGSGSVIELNGVGALGISQAFSAPGVYTINASVSDGDLTGSRSSALDMPAYVVVYDPSSGFVTGGGWFDSPTGACLWSGCASDGSTTGKASFGFVSRYKQGATTPTGNTEFQFKAGGLTFRSTSYQWLVVAGARAQYKGEGQITGDGATYGFLITAIDGSLAGGGGTDRFRIKLWNTATGAIVYDNQIGELEDSDAATVIGGGSIVIHR